MKKLIPIIAICLAAGLLSGCDGMMYSTGSPTYVEHGPGYYRPYYGPARWNRSYWRRHHGGYSPLPVVHVNTHGGGNHHGGHYGPPGGSSHHDGHYGPPGGGSHHGGHSGPPSGGRSLPVVHVNTRGSSSHGGHFGPPG